MWYVLSLGSAVHDTMQIASFDLITHHDSHTSTDYSRLDFSVQSIDRRGFVACHENPLLFAYWTYGGGNVSGVGMVQPMIWFRGKSLFGINKSPVTLAVPAVTKPFSSLERSHLSVSSPKPQPYESFQPRSHFDDISNLQSHRIPHARHSLLTSRLKKSPRSLSQCSWLLLLVIQLSPRASRERDWKIPAKT